ncbi:MAG: hypothetical protein CVV45_00205 [Spirochaetae bacterium HGW-Spirochaetae-10]|nr:MAG: hypothetical protein CVV45_00205 [Spirochaetae bacterium HGW-Spirochaetae-10]
MDTSFRTLSAVLFIGSPISFSVALVVFIWHRIWNRFAIVPLLAPPLYTCAIYAITLLGSEPANSLIESEHDALSYLLFLIITGTSLGLLITARIPENTRFYTLVAVAYIIVIAMPALIFVGQDGRGKADVVHAMWAFPLGLGFATGLHRRTGVLISLLAALTLACLDEMIQLYLPHRVFDLHDVWLNLTAASSGYAIGIVRQFDGVPLYTVIARRWKARRRRQNS